MNMRRTLTAIIAVALVTLGGPVLPASATFPGPNGRIAYQSLDGEIYSIAADGSGPVNLTRDPAYDAFPRWSPDGSRILFESARDGESDIWVMNADGSSPVQLTNSAGQQSWAHWSPDGTRIVYSSKPTSGDAEMFVMDADGTNVVQITNNSVDDLAGEWSPDGSAIIVARSGALRLIAPNGTGDRPLVDHPGLDSDHSWSPDGSRIVFYHQQPTSGLSTIRPDGTDETAIVTGGTYNRMPAWSPDGSRIAFVGWDSLATMAPDGSGVTWLGVQGWWPSWQPTRSSGEARISMTKTVDQPTVGLGGSVTFTITVVNHGPAPAAAVTVTDILPAGLALAGFDAGAAPCQPEPFTCALATLGVGETLAITLTVVATELGELTNTATVVSDNDPNPGDDAATATVTVQGPQDSDGDGVPDLTDNCPFVINPDQADGNGDGVGTACDPRETEFGDPDGDGLTTVEEGFLRTNPYDPDTDRDWVSDGWMDPDRGGPILAGPDNCALVSNTDQTDSDGDGVGDPCDEPADTDLDDDGIGDTVDNCLDVPNPDQVDTDADGAGDPCDADDDGDGVADGEDAFPNDPGESTDTDDDGIGNNADADDDGDGDLDAAELACGSDPLQASSTCQTAYAFQGFFQPVDNLPTRNTMKAGAAVPIKFSLGGDFGLDIFTVGQPSSRTVDCLTGSTSDAVEQTLTAGDSSLQYDPLTDRYTYVWKTKKIWANSCRVFELGLSDGSTHTALFQFTK